MKQRGEVELSRIRVEVLGFQGADGFAFLLVDLVKRAAGQVNDSYCPWPDYGYVWLRKQNGGMWLASGKIDARLIGDSPGSPEGILYFIAEEMLDIDDQVVSCVERIEVIATHVSTNEEDPLVFNGSRQ